MLNVEGSVSSRTVRRMVTEGGLGVAAEILQLVDREAASAHPEDRRPPFT